MLGTTQWSPGPAPEDATSLVSCPDTLVGKTLRGPQDENPHCAMTSNYSGDGNANRVMENWLEDFSYMARCKDWGGITYTCHP